MRRSSNARSLSSATGRVIVCGLALMLFGTPARGQDQALVFGVLNQQSPALTAERWNPILAYVTNKTGVPLKLRMGPVVERTNEMMAQGEFDFVFTNHNFKPEYDALGLKVIARWSGPPSHAAIAVLADSPVANLKQLAGLRVAFPSPHAFLGYAVPAVALRSAGVDVQEVFAANQEGGLAQLKAGRVDAVAANSRFLAAFAEREGMKVRVVHLSAPFPDLAVVANPRTPAATVDRVQRALVGMSADPEAQELLVKSACPGFTLANDKDYDGVRAVYRQAAK